MTTELDVLKIVVAKLESVNIPYMVSGSIASNFYAVPRMTRDIDIIIDVGENDANKVFSLFSDDFYVDLELIKRAIHDKHMFNIIHNEGVVKVDFIVRRDSEYPRLEFERRQTVTLEDLNIAIASAEDLVISKLYWAKDSLSEMQPQDVCNLLAIKGIDSDYIENWVRKLGIDEVYEKVRK